MADTTMYAWSKFKAEVNEWGMTTKWINVGDQISQSDLKVSDDEWQALVDSGAVRPDPYPDISPDVAPAEYYNDHPDEMPESTLTAASPSAEVMAASDAGQPLPTGDEKTTTGDAAATSEESKKAPWQNK